MKKMMWILFSVIAGFQSYAQSSRSGVGSIVYPGGVTFRVWAPNASSVSVAGSFNGWNIFANPLTSEGTNGWWSADVPGAMVGQEYKYVINGSLWRQDPRSRELASTGSDNSVIIDPEAYDWGSDAPVLTPENERVIYELHIGTFNDANGADSLRGTFMTAIEKLPHIRDMGFTVVEVMPVNEFSTGTSWGYNGAYPFSVENSYGGVTGFKDFVKACHANGMAVYLDIVHNHWGPGGSDWGMWQFDGWSTNGHGGIFFYNENGKCCTDWGNTRPDYGRREVKDYILDSLRMWVNEYHVDGFRWDTPHHMLYDDNGDFIEEGAELLTEVIEMMNTELTNTINIAEDSRWFSGFDGHWQTAFPRYIGDVLAEGLDADRSMWTIRDRINDSAGFRRVIFTESHDVVGDLNSADGAARLPYRIFPDDPASYWARKRSTLGATLVFTCAGIPMIFQGQEMLENELFSDVLPVDWNKTNAFSHIVRLYKDLITLRKNDYRVTGGLQGTYADAYHVDNVNKVVAFERRQEKKPKEDVVVIANFANVTYTNYLVEFPKAGAWHVIFNSDEKKYGSDFGGFGKDIIANGNPAMANLEIGPYSALIFSQRPTDSLAIEEAWWDDTIEGNANDNLDPDETVRETLVLQNTGENPATNITARIISPIPEITILQDASTFPDIDAFGVATNNVDFSYSLDRQLSCGTFVTFPVEIQFNNETHTNYFTHQVGKYITLNNQYASTNVPMDITNSIYWLTSSLDVPSVANDIIQDVKVSVRLDHSWIDDLTIYLRNPEGKFTLLSYYYSGGASNMGTGTCGVDVVYTKFEDTADSYITSGTAPFTNSFRPYYPFSNLQGNLAGGKWELYIFDDFVDDNGTLLCWELEIETRSERHFCESANRIPIVTNQTISISPNASTNLPLWAWDADGDSLEWLLRTEPNHGTLSAFDPDTGIINYTPIYGYSGNDTLSYVVFDNFSASASNGVLTINVEAPLDTDGDGLPDFWETLHYGNPTNALPSADSDADGQSALAEYLSGTDPNDINSLLWISSITRTNANWVRLAWPGIGKVRYRVQYSYDMNYYYTRSRSFENEISEGVYGAPTLESYDYYYSGTSPRYFRIKAVNE